MHPFFSSQTAAGGAAGIQLLLRSAPAWQRPTRTRGYAANKYGAKKDKDYEEIIRTKSLDYAYKSITFGTFGAFGSGTWDVIERACDPRTHPDATGDYDPWRRPAPKRDFILSLGFALQRAREKKRRGRPERGPPPASRVSRRRVAGCLECLFLIRSGLGCPGTAED